MALTTSKQSDSTIIEIKPTYLSQLNASRMEIAFATEKQSYLILVFTYSWVLDSTVVLFWIEGSFSFAFCYSKFWSTLLCQDMVKATYTYLHILRPSSSSTFTQKVYVLLISKPNLSSSSTI